MVVSLAYLAYVVRILDGTFWSSGMGDWMDPYFINALLEHWHQSLRTLRDPASPPMFFPAKHTLGYSHSLMLYAPFYVPLRLWLHPFVAGNLTMFAVILTGVLCLYVLLRKCLHVPFSASLLLTVFFVSSQNVLGQATSVWAQRASVFLIPAILLIAWMSWQRRHSFLGLVLAACSGLLSVLLFAHDFYTAHFALFFALSAAAVAALAWRDRLGIETPREMRRAERLTLATATLAGLWALFVWWSGGVSHIFLGITFRSHDWRRPAAIAVVLFAVLMGVRHRIRFAATEATLPWTRAAGAGAIAGVAVFLWIYWLAYREHRRFPNEEVWNALAAIDPASSLAPWTFLGSLSVYETARPFQLVALATLLVWVPWFRANTTVRRLMLGVLLLSAVVLILPLKFNEFSLWFAVFHGLPGFGVIRDPKRIIYLYELFVVLAMGAVLTRTVRQYRIAVMALVCLLLVASPNRQTFVYARPIDLFDRWIAAPVDIDPSCRAFFMKRASESYRSRSNDMRTLYSIDAMFLSLQHTVPTMNGYSAWVPEGWELYNPEDPAYTEYVKRWISKNRLRRVCELDVDARTMRPAK